MDTLTADRARELLGGVLNGHDVLGGQANHNGVTLLTTPHRWQRRPRRPRRERREVRPGSRLIGTGGVLLFLLGSGLLAVSFAAQYAYVLHERHQHIASLIEAGALDVGLMIFSLLALGLARAGLSAKIERAAVIACATGSAVMNYAAADVTSPRSVLAYCMPPVFLAFVVDRVVRTIQRHVLGMSEARSPWAVFANAVRRITRFWVLSVLYVLRFLVDCRATCAGIKQAIVNATPLPASAQPERLKPDREKPDRGSDTKTARFQRLVAERHGELSTIPLGQVSQIATAIATEASLHPASARTALLKAVRAALPVGGSDAR
jgi:hypothetical protein